MNIMSNILTSKTLLLEVEVLITVLVIGGWGGFVSYLMRNSDRRVFRNINRCLAQIITSCFTAFILSAITVERNMSFNMVLLVSGLGGFLAIPILKILSKKIKKYLSETDIFK